MNVFLQALEEPAWKMDFEAVDALEHEGGTHERQAPAGRPAAGDGEHVIHLDPAVYSSVPL